MTEKDLERLDDSNLSKVLETEQGRSFYWRVMGKLGVLRSVVAGEAGMVDRDRMVFNAARQDFGLWMLSEASRVNPKMAQLMQSEAMARKLEEER